MAIGSAGSLCGQSLYWDISTNSGLQAGSGSWSTNNGNGNRNWVPNIDGTGGETSWINNYDAIFQTSGTSNVSISVSGTVQVNSITFNGTGYTLSGGTITLTGAGGNITVNADATISSQIAGSVGLTKKGNANLILSGANTYTGLTDIQTGTLTLGTSNVFADASTLKISGGILSLLTYNDTVAGVQLTGGSISSSSGVLTSTTAFDLQSGTVSGILGGSVGLNKTTGGTVNLSGVNTYSGQTNVSGGKLTVDSTGAINFTTQVSIGAGEFNYNSGTTLTKAVTFSLSGGTLSGTGTIQNAFTVTSGNTYSPGAVGAPGAQTLSGGVTFGSDSIFNWDLDVTGSSSADFDRVTASPLAGSGAQFKVVLGSGDSYTAPFWDSARNWTSTEIFGTNANLSNIFSINSTAPSNEGSFSFTDVSGGTRNQLTWTPIPEPTSALGGLLLAAGLLRRKRCLPSA